MHYLDTISSSGFCLDPAQPQLRREVEEMEELFDAKLGVDIRSRAYFYLLHNRKTMQKAWCKGTALFERAGFEIAFPFIRAKVRQLYSITAESAALSLQGIRQVFEIVNQRLADDRPYLAGDRLSAADLTFAALAARVLQPPEHLVVVAKIEELPIDLASVMRQLQATVAGTHAGSLYREQRRVK